MSEVLKQKNYQVIPFVFDGKIEEIANDIIEKQREEKYKKSVDSYISELRWNLKRTSGRHLFGYINNLISEENIKSRIGIVLELELDKCDCSKLGISKNNEFKRVISKGTEQYQFKYNFINVYLFETGIGFLVYSIEYLNDSKIDIDDIIGGNYYYKKYDESGIYEGYLAEIDKINKSIAKRKSELEVMISENDCYEEKKEKLKIRIRKAEEKLRKVKSLEKLVYDEENSSIKSKHTKRVEWVKLILDDLNLDGIKFIGLKNNPGYSHVFSYINLSNETSESDIEKYLYLLKNSYKNTYKPSRRIINDKYQEDNLQLFENIWWGASIEGLTCITQYTNNDNLTNEFINSYSGNIESTYLYMYILMLHMRYALLNYTSEAVDINKEVKDYQEVDIRKINELKEKIILLDFRCIFNDVSNISSQVKVFDMMRESLRIDRLKEALYREIENLGQLGEKYREKKQNESLVKIEKLYFCVALFSLSSFIKDIVGWIPIFESEPILYVGLVGIFFVAMWLIFKHTKKE